MIALVVMADHGNDPTHWSQPPYLVAVPVLVYQRAGPHATRVRTTLSDGATEFFRALPPAKWSLFSFLLRFAGDTL